MANSPLEKALADRKLLREAIEAGVGEPAISRYEPAGRTSDKSRLSFVATTETDPVRREQFAPFGRRLIGAMLDILVLLIIWAVGFAGTAAFAVPIYTVLGEGNSGFLGPVLEIFVVTIPFWTMWVFNAQGWSPAGRLTDLRSVDAHGAPPGVRAGLIRTIAFIPSMLPLGLGFWWAAWDREGQTWHDRIAGTRVIQLLR